MSDATERQGESPVEHARCGLPPQTSGSSVFCPSCFDFCTRNSLRKAVSAWNEIQGGIVSAAKTNAERQREFRQRKADTEATEVRGIFAHAEDHQQIKNEAAKIARRRQRVANRAAP